MKNKKTLFILIPLVLAIWGVVVWKLIDYQPSGDTAHPGFTASPEDEPVDTAGYELRFGYNDPFLRSSYVATKNSVKKTEKSNNIKKVDLTEAASIMRPADLIYHGEISGHRDHLGLLEIKGDKVLVSENSVVGEYTILLVESDSLILSYCDKRFTYEKE